MNKNADDRQILSIVSNSEWTWQSGFEFVGKTQVEIFILWSPVFYGQKWNIWW